MSTRQRPEAQPQEKKTPTGRPPLPPELAQTAIIRERVTEGQRERYVALGGKAWLLEQLAAAKVPRRRKAA